MNADHSPVAVRFATVLAWIYVTAAVAPTMSAAQEVDIPDDHLRTAVQDALGKRSSEAITVADMESLRVLHSERDDIADLTGLEHATGLTELDLAFNDIVDASPLAGLTSLSRLDLSNNKVSDLEPLSNLRSLIDLGLSDNRISDARPLAGLSSLIDLGLSGNGISDLAPLTGMGSLSGLELSNNAISDLTPISLLTRLRDLDLSNNGIADIAPLSGLTSLQTLHLSGNGIANLSPLAGLALLDTLGLSNNRISEVSVLTGLASLRFLHLSDNGISDLSPLAGLESLHTLHLSGNGIADLRPLAKFGVLEVLHLSDNEIWDLRPLAGLDEVEVLHLSNNRISDLTPLEDLRDLDIVELSNNRISDLTPLSRLRLLTLRLAGNQIADVSPLRTGSLLVLDLSGNEITDVLPVASHLSLLSLDLSDNRITDPSVLSALLFLNILDLSDNRITAARLVNVLLQRLDLSGNEVSNASSLRSAPALRHLDLSNNGIEDLSGLEELESLRTVNAVANAIVDMGPAARMPALRTLYLGGNAVADLAPLASDPESLRSVSLWRNPLSDDSVHVQVPAMEQRGVGVTGGGWRVPFFPPGGFQQGFVRVVSSVFGVGETGEGGTKRAWIYGSADDDGPAGLLLGARNARHFNADDLVAGNPRKGLRSTLDANTGGTLDVYASGAIDVLSYIRTSDGFVASMHDTAPWRPADDRLDHLRGRTVAESGRAAGGHFVPIFNPASNPNQRSMLRLVNPSGEDTDVAVYAVDDHGVAAGPVRLSLAALSTRTLDATELESGAADLSGSLGDGAGKWRLVVSAAADIHVMNLMSSPTGHLTNLSTSSDADLVVPMFPAASHPTQQGFVRVANLGSTAGTAQIRGYDDAGASYGPLVLQLPAGRTVHFNSDDWESGNAEKGLEGAAGTGEGPWRLEFESTWNLAVSAYVRTSDGFLTSMHDLVDRDTCATEDVEGGKIAARSERTFSFRDCREERRVPFFNPASNTRQVSSLRLVNRGESDAAVTIFGVDDDGAERGPATLSLSAGTARALTSLALESGDGEGLAGALGDGTGKWELRVFVAGESPADVMVMNLLESPTGHLTNLSTWPDDELRLE
ncbi:MAG: leucine-rich repeat domain-containing protein [Gammaproteobacteria bacterium]|nr:leucine-rich repeat domain-containing protein [Gammaproteobacteria bacterium]